MTFVFAPDYRFEAMNLKILRFFGLMSWFAEVNHHYSPNLWTLHLLCCYSRLYQVRQVMVSFFPDFFMAKSYFNSMHHFLSVRLTDQRQENIVKTYLIYPFIHGSFVLRSFFQLKFVRFTVLRFEFFGPLNCHCPIKLVELLFNFDY